MGLDMYLKARRYISPFGDEGKALGAKVAEVIGFKWPVENQDEFDWNGRVSGVEVRAGYWRKANQIHGWFVDNVQKGEDDCKEYYVEREQLRTLIELCRKAIQEKNTDLLPNRSGFFFGSTAYDEWYWEDLRTTIEMLERALQAFPGDHWEFTYQSSW